jgi:hypothetical protein
MVLIHMLIRCLARPTEPSLSPPTQGQKQESKFENRTIVPANRTGFYYINISPEKWGVFGLVILEAYSTNQTLRSDTV